MIEYQARGEGCPGFLLAAETSIRSHLNQTGQYGLHTKTNKMSGSIIYAIPGKSEKRGMMSRSNNITRLFSKASRLVSRSKPYVEIKGSILPPPDRRWCGTEFKDDEFYLRSAEEEAMRLVKHFGCDKSSRILDVGCGQGRLPIGLIRTIGDLDYIGIDVDRRSVEWCRKYIGQIHPTFKFMHLDLYNERYNRNGVRIDADFRFAVKTDSIDIVYLYSVFSHTTEEVLRIYLKEFARILRANGSMFFTTFVEEDVPNISINPEGYSLKCSGPLHVVRYNKAYLISILEECGFELTMFSHATEADGQSGLYLTHIS